MYAKKSYIWNPIKYARETDRYLKSIADDLVITCDEIIDVLDVIPINWNDKKKKCKIDKTYALQTFLLVIIFLLITIIGNYYTKHW